MRRRMKVTPISYNSEIARMLCGAAKQLADQGVAKIDGRYVISAQQPLVDFKLVHPARTREQRKARRKFASMGLFCGFIDPEMVETEINEPATTTP